MERRVDAERLIRRIAGDQLGLATDAQILGAGISRRGLQRRISSGAWERELPNVVAMGGAPRTWQRNLLAAAYSLGPEAVASHRAAARLVFDGFDVASVEVSTTKGSYGRPPVLPDGTKVVVHRVDWRLLPRMTRHGPIPVTTVPRTIIDLAGIKDRRVERCLDDALRRNLTTIDEMWLLLDKHWMSGRRGVRIVRNLLVPRTKGLAPGDSALQMMLSKIVVREDLPRPTLEHPVMLSFGVVHLDAAYPEVWLAIELDGYAYHSDRQTFERDRERDNELRALGWTVYRFTWAMLKFDAAGVARLIRDHIERLAS